jgi:hypothetical protein
MKYLFHETFTIDFTIEADSYQKAYALYMKLGDKNIKLGYSDWKGVEHIEFDPENQPKSKYYVWSREDTETPKLIRAQFFGNEEEE